MSKAKTLATTVSTGGALEDPNNIPAADIDGLAAVATSGAYADLSGKPSTNDFLPSQTGNSGKLLSTNGTDPSWVDAPVGFSSGKALFFSSFN